MANNILALVDVVELRSGALQGTGLTSTDADVLATDLKDGRIEGMKSGLFMMAVEDADAGDADETYVVDLIGRDADGDAYEVLATITVLRGTAGEKIHAVSVDRFRKQLNYRFTATGTTPSLVFGLWVVATEITYGPSDESLIVA